MVRNQTKQAIIPYRVIVQIKFSSKSSDKPDSYSIAIVFASSYVYPLPNNKYMIV